jgi:hypothetical protein
MKNSRKSISGDTAVLYLYLFLYLKKLKRPFMFVVMELTTLPPEANTAIRDASVSPLLVLYFS